jgi:drug/metabolite transporter (DMT)-like permease
LVGEVASLAAAGIWAFSMSAFSAFGQQVPASVLNLFKNGIAIIGLGIVILLVTQEWPRDFDRYALLAVSGVVGIAIGDTFLFAALKRLGAQLTSATQCLAPPAAAAMAWVSFGESLTLLEAVGIAITVSSVCAIILLRGRGGEQATDRRELRKGVFYAVLAALGQAFAMVSSRYAFQGVSVPAGTVLRMLPAFLVLAAFAPPSQFHSLWRNRRVLFILAAAAFAGTFLGMLLMSTGAKYAKAGVAAALSSTYPVWIIPIAHFLLKERVERAAILLTGLAVFGVALLVAPL